MTLRGRFSNYSINSNDVGGYISNYSINSYDVVVILATISILINEVDGSAKQIY